MLLTSAHAASLQQGIHLASADEKTIFVRRRMMQEGRYFSHMIEYTIICICWTSISPAQCGSVMTTVCQCATVIFSDAQCVLLIFENYDY